jgi:hypothetical protein
MTVLFTHKLRFYKGPVFYEVDTDYLSIVIAAYTAGGVNDSQGGLLRRNVTAWVDVAQLRAAWGRRFIRA